MKIRIQFKNNGYISEVDKNDFVKHEEYFVNDGIIYPFAFIKGAEFV